MFGGIVKLHKELDRRVRRLVMGGEWQVEDVEIVYPLAPSAPFVCVSIYYPDRMVFAEIDIECTRLDRMCWGLEDDVYEDNGCAE